MEFISLWFTVMLSATEVHVLYGNTVVLPLLSGTLSLRTSHYLVGTFLEYWK